MKAAGMFQKYVKSIRLRPDDDKGNTYLMFQKYVKSIRLKDLQASTYILNNSFRSMLNQLG